MKVSRATFLLTLESVEAGLTPTDTIEQSSCLCFQDGQVWTYNEEIACRRESGLDESFAGAVPASPLLEQLRKWTDETIEVEMAEGCLRIRGKHGRMAEINREAEVVLSLEQIEQPKDWLPLPAGFAEAVKTVQYCTGRDQSEFAKTCVHLSPSYVEACDNFQVCRWDIATGLKADALVLQKSIKHIVDLGMAEFGETEYWLHFRNDKGLVLSCRRYLEDYPDTEPAFQVEGQPIALPKSLGEAADRAQVFSKKNVQGDRVLVELKPGKLRLTGEGVQGRYREPSKVQYDGPALAFLVSPEVLQDIVKRHTDCVITRDRLAVISGPYKYVLCLFLPEEPVLAEAVQLESEAARARKAGKRPEGIVMRFDRDGDRAEGFADGQEDTRTLQGRKPKKGREEG